MPINIDIHDERVVFWNRLYRITLLILVLFSVTLGTVAVTKIYIIANDIKTSQEQFEASSVQARQANINRQNQTNNLINCLVLAKFDYPPKQFTTKKGTQEALDKCAKQQ